MKAPRRLMVLGDWNARPDNRRLWPLTRAGLRVASPGPGSFGEIDYALTDAKVPKISRGRRRGYGSDHDLVLFTVGNLRGGSWNALAGRDPFLVATSVKFIMRRYELDFLALQEASGYVSTIRRRGLVVAARSTAGGSDANPVVIRPGLDYENVRARRLSRHGWPLATGGTHAAAWSTAVLLDGWLEVWSVHLPNYERSRAHATAYLQAVARLLLRAVRHRLRRAR